MPLEAVLAGILPLIGITGDIAFDGAEAVVGPVIIATMLLPYLVPPHQKVLLPGVSVLERFVSRLRSRVEERLWHLLISFLDRLRKGLRRRDVFVTTSVRYADPRIGLLEGEAWEGTRPFICRSLGLPASANEAFSVLRHELDQTYKAVATNFPNSSGAGIEQVVDGKDDLILTGLDKLDEPDSLIALRR